MANTTLADYTVAADDSSAANKAKADATCTGTDDHVDINTAIDTVSAAGGGYVYCFPGGYDIAGAIIPKDNVYLWCAPHAAHLTWSGAAGGYMISSSAAALLARFGLDGFYLNVNDAAGADADMGIRLYAAQNCLFRNLTIDNCDGGDAFTFRTFTNQHFFGNDFENIVVNGALRGMYSQGVSATEYVQGNYFRNIRLVNIGGHGVDFQHYTRLNRFYGLEIDLTAENAVAFKMGILAGAVYNYANQVHGMFVDATGLTAAECLKLLYTKQTFIADLYHLPTDWPGTFLTDTGSNSYFVFDSLYELSQNNMRMRGKGVSWQFAAGV